MDIRELLPIGSIIVLKGGTKKLMVFGIKQSNEGEDVEYDYLGVIYPEGNIGLESQFFFNHNDIEKVYFRGFEDSEREDFLTRLQAYYDTEK